MSKVCFAVFPLFLWPPILLSFRLEPKIHHPPNSALCLPSGNSATVSDSPRYGLPAHAIGQIGSEICPVTCCWPKRNPGTWFLSDKWPRKDLGVQCGMLKALGFWAKSQSGKTSGVIGIVEPQLSPLSRTAQLRTLCHA